MIAFMYGAVQFQSQVQNFISSMTVDIFLDLIILFTHYRIHSKNKAVIFSLSAQKQPGPSCILQIMLTNG